MHHEKMMLLAALLEIEGNRAIKRKCGGICNCVSYLLGKHHTLRPMMQRLFMKWPHFSGQLGFPIPSCKKGVGPGGMYYSTNRMWDRRTGYGKLRRDLLEFMIKTLKEELNEPV